MSYSEQRDGETNDAPGVEAAATSLAALGLSSDQVGIVIVDHGSRRQESNDMLIDVAAMLRAAGGWSIVEPAHMELAEPSIPTAFDRAVEQGARLVVVHPYLLAPGRHWRHDIPRLAAQAAARHAGVAHVVTDPIGLHPLMAQIMQERILACLRAHGGQALSEAQSPLGQHSAPNDVAGSDG